MIKRYDCFEWNTTPEPSEDGDYVDFEDHQLAMMENDIAMRDIQRQLAAVTEDLEEWRFTNRIDELQRQLADAIRERDQYKAACEMATALQSLGAVQVAEGGGAVLLDTSGRKA